MTFGGFRLGIWDYLRFPITNDKAEVITAKVVIYCGGRGRS